MNVEKKLIDMFLVEMGATGGDVSLFFKGRVALYAILKAMGIGPGDEVILPAYTCVVVPNAIKYLGAKPRYVDIDIATFSAAPASILAAIGPATKAVLCQNTYGLSYGVDEIAQACRSKGIWTVEDCTHGFSGSYKGKPNGSWCDAAFFSSQWNKPFSTGVGGYGYATDKALARKIAELEASLPRPSPKTSLMLWGLMQVRRLISPSTYYAFVQAYRYLSKRNLVTGSSTGEELENAEMPGDYLMGMSAVQMRAGTRALAKLAKLNRIRDANGALYSDFLARLGKNHVDPSLRDDHLFLKYPLLVKDREEFMECARKANIPLADWFRSPLHPVEGGFSKWDFDPELFPNAVFAAAHVVNIPTDTKNPRKVLDFLRLNSDQILDQR